MKLASIMPMNAYDLVDADYNFCFAELALRNMEYARYYRLKAMTSIVIMDTMIFEHGCRLPIVEWLDAIELVHPTVAVAMDVMEDAYATKKNYQLLKDFTTIPLMGVAQGRNYAEFIECFGYFLERCEWIGLPVQIKSRRTERFELIKAFCNMNMDDKHIHLLGASHDSLVYEQVVKDVPWITGVDTTKPIAAALNGFELPAPFAVDATDRPKTFFDFSRSACIGARALMLTNSRFMSNLLGDQTCIVG